MKHEKGMSKEQLTFSYPVVFVFLFYLVLFRALSVSKGQCLKVAYTKFTFWYINIKNQ